MCFIKRAGLIKYVHIIKILENENQTPEFCVCGDMLCYAGTYAVAVSVRGSRDCRDSSRFIRRARAENMERNSVVIADTLIKNLMLGLIPHFVGEWRNRGIPSLRGGSSPADEFRTWGRRPMMWLAFPNRYLVGVIASSFEASRSGSACPLFQEIKLYFQKILVADGKWLGWATSEPAVRHTDLRRDMRETFQSCRTTLFNLAYSPSADRIGLV